MPGQAYKRCTRCDETKHPDDFHASSHGGRQSQCKACRNAHNLQKRREDPERFRETDRRSYRRHKREKDARAAREREHHPEKVRARCAVNDAIREGRLQKPDTCEDCGQECESRSLHGHHQDYSNPLEVEWLCAACHTKRHT